MKSTRAVAAIVRMPRFAARLDRLPQVAWQAMP